MILSSDDAAIEFSLNFSMKYFEEESVLPPSEWSFFDGATLEEFSLRIQAWPESALRAGCEFQSFFESGLGRRGALSEDVSRGVFA